VENDSGAEGRVRRVDAGDDLLFPSDGHFSRVVPLSQAGDEDIPPSEAGEEVAPSVVASAPDESDERDETTLVPTRVMRDARLSQVSRPKKGVEQSWGFMAAVLALSVAAGVAAGAYMIRSQRTADAFRPDVEAAAANATGEKVVAAQPAEQPVPQAPANAPQTEQHDRLAAATTPAVASAATAAPDEADAKAESVNPSAPTPKASPRAAEPVARRAAETETRAERPARAASEARDASPAPRLARSDAAPRHAERPATANAAPPERSLPISSPPPSARPKKVIQWP
jgi:hypothetical protein